MVTSMDSLMTPARVGDPPDTARRRVLLVDEHAVVRNGLAGLLNLTPDLTVCGEAASAEEAPGKVEMLNPDVVVLELNLGGTSGLELIKSLKARRPELPILVLSMHDESFYAERCLRAGARGYIMKKEPIEAVEQAIRQILEGKVYLSRKMSEQILLAVARGDSAKIGSPVSQLSDRELQVYECIGRGLGASEIARKLRLSVKTIATYQAKLKEKLHLKRSSELFQHALHWGERS
jgi:DNA-binding NarL/FixJ family response regulator